MASVKGLVRRLRGDDVVALKNQTAALTDLMAVTHHHAVTLSEQVAAMNHEIGLLREQVANLDQSVLMVNHAAAHAVELTEAHHAVLLELNHDVRAGSERALPLFLGYTERLRLDTDTAVGAAEVIGRQLAILEDLMATAGESQYS